MTREEADSRLRQAIIDHATAYEMHVDGELLNDYAIIAHWQRMVDDGSSPYTQHYSTPTVPHHVAVGLFSTAVMHLEAGDEGPG